MTLYRKIYLSFLKKFKFLPSKIYLNYHHEYYNQQKLDLKNPLDFNEKIQWLKIYYRPNILTQLVDKYEVRKYVKEKIGEEYLNELYNVYHRSGDVDFNKLPQRFVLKAAHGYNFNLIVKDKSKLDFLKTRLTLIKWMNRNQYYRGGQEWAYKNVRPKIIAEKYLPEVNDGRANDYKFFCFNGVPKYITVIGKDNTSFKFRCNYDIHWNRLEFLRAGTPYYQNEVPKPENFEEMLDISKKLAKGFPFVRVDLYNIAGKVLFGELTFYPTDGRQSYIPKKYNRIIGDMLVLPEVPVVEKT